MVSCNAVAIHSTQRDFVAYWCLHVRIDRVDPCGSGMIGERRSVRGERALISIETASRKIANTRVLYHRLQLAVTRNISESKAKGLKSRAQGVPSRGTAAGALPFLPSYIVGGFYQTQGIRTA